MNNPLRLIRTRCKLTAIALAERAGTTESRIYAFERRRHNPHPDEARSIAAALNAKVADVFPDLKGET